MIFPKNKYRLGKRVAWNNLIKPNVNIANVLTNNRMWGKRRTFTENVLI